MKLITTQLMEIAVMMNITTQTLYNLIEARPITRESILDLVDNREQDAHDLMCERQDAQINIVSYFDNLEETQS